jgi:hypothetical protein
MNITHLSIKIFVLSSFAITGLVRSQYLSHSTLKERIVHDTLVDKCNGNKFVLNKNRVSISALDSVGKILWESSPAEDSKLKEYRTKRRRIVQFCFDTLQTADKLEVIRIVYSNTQFGYLLKSSGKFIFLGQD